MKYYCYDQFKTLHIRSTNAGQVLVGSCCASLTEPVVASEFDFEKNSFLQTQRQAALADRPAPGCVNCWRQEQQNPPSRRYFSNLNRPQDLRVELNRLDVTVQNVCNLACIMCSSYSSSRWAKEDGLKNQDYDFQEKLKLFKRIDHKNIFQIHFTGGEPLMTTEHIKMLDIYSEHSDLGQLHISYNTNATFFPDDHVLECWSKVKAIDLVISLDGIGSAAELIRWPCQWETVQNNITKFFQLKNQIPGLKISFICCISNYNLFESAEVIEFARSHDPNTVVHFQVNHRPFFAPAIIPEHMVDPVLKKLSNYADLANLLPTIGQRPAEQVFNQEWRSMINYLNQLDQRRGTHWKTVLQIGSFL
jgi:sulfatase maturation enzyme AslB (radical SAM superfamily)